MLHVLHVLHVLRRTLLLLSGIALHDQWLDRYIWLTRAGQSTLLLPSAVGCVGHHNVNIDALAFSTSIANSGTWVALWP